jgi:hypothetical protein
LFLAVTGAGKVKLGATIMEPIAVLKILFFLMWPVLIMGLIILIRKYRKNKGTGNTLWHH